MMLQLVLFLKRTFIARMDMKKLNSSGNVINRTILCREHQEDRLSVEFVSLNCEVKSFWRLFLPAVTSMYTTHVLKHSITIGLWDINGFWEVKMSHKVWIITCDSPTASEISPTSCAASLIVWIVATVVAELFPFNDFKIEYCSLAPHHGQTRYALWNLS